MILLELFWSFFQIGLFSFGGGYAAPAAPSTGYAAPSGPAGNEFGDLADDDGELPF